MGRERPRPYSSLIDNPLSSAARAGLANQENAMLNCRDGVVRGPSECGACRCRTGPRDEFGFSPGVGCEARRQAQQYAAGCVVGMPAPGRADGLLDGAGVARAFECIARRGSAQQHDQRTPVTLQPELGVVPVRRQEIGRAHV